MILNPCLTKPVAHVCSDSAETYLLKCKQNIEAEIWSLVSNSRQEIKVVLMNGCISSVFKSGVCVPCDQLLYNLLVLKGSLCLVTRLRERGVGFEKGKHLRQSQSSFLVGYVKPFVYEYAAIVNFLEGTIPPILRDIASLTCRTPFGYDKRPFSDKVASNALQQRSVLGLAYTVEGIQGPPGTGKSSTIFHIVNSAMPAGMVAIVTCVQNRAVDALACKFQSSSIKFLVLGSPDRLGDTAKLYALESCVESAVVTEVMELSRVSRILDLILSACRKREASHRFTSSGWRRWWTIYSREPLMEDLAAWSMRVGKETLALSEAKQSAAQLLSSEATVFLCTVDALCRLGKTRRRILIIDEAGTVPEYKLPLAVSLGIEAVIAVGDQSQLQPFTHTGMSNGFFHRLAKTVSISMLEEQFRMHPAISDLVSSSFYSNRLFTNPCIAEARCAVPCAGIHWVDYPDLHAETSRGGALCNDVELGILRVFMVGVLGGFLARGKSVMITTFYREQFHRLMQLGENLGLVGVRMQGTKTERFFTHPLFRISTVDASQGSESDVLVLSCVRSNPKHHIGFLSQSNRVCVALSRAREHLIVIGSSRTLGDSVMWGALFKAANQHSFQEPFDFSTENSLMPEDLLISVAENEE